jgi:hypothetical protein
VDIFADPELRLRVLVALLATLAGVRLIVVGLCKPERRWSLIVGGVLIAVSLARELPGMERSTSDAFGIVTCRNCMSQRAVSLTP